jgi:hypothetical protein
MAKKTAMTRAAASSAPSATQPAPATTAPKSTITCNGYELHVINNPNGFSLRLDLTSQPDAVQYHLRINSTNDRTELVQTVLAKLAELWPGSEWHFTAGASGEITEIV